MSSPPAVIPLTRPVTTPRRFGNYVLLRKIAEGGMAEIFLAKQVGAEGFERNVVIKCMLDHFTQSRDFVSMFLDEARLAARLHHPNIVQISDLGVADNRYYICMEYLAGEDLDAVISATHALGQWVPIATAARIILSALEGLEFAHNYQEQGQPVGLVHRDISPSNIFVTFQGTVKVLDFGIAKASSRMTQTQPGLLKGKWGYMSPEQARGESIDARSDLFSLGVTFYELLTVRRVFEKDNEIGVLLALMAQPIPPPSQRRPDVPPELDRIVMKALERRPEDRYSSAAEMRADLEEFLRGTPSVPGTSQLAQYMQGLFGQSHVEHKTKVPSLTELAAIPSPPEAEVRRPLHTDIMGLEKTLVRPSEPHGVPAVGAPASVPAPAPAPVPVSAPPAQSTGLTMAIGALAAVALLAIGGGAAWYFMPRPQPQAPVVVTAPPVAPPVVAQPTPPPAPPPTSPTPPMAELSKPPPREATPKPQTPKQGRPQSPFSQESIKQAMRPHLGKLEQCAKTHRENLPPSTQVTLLITVESTGAVANTQISDAKAVPDSLAQCLKAEMSKVAFKADAQRPTVQIQLPFVLKR
jgi:serine/threonine-protein kinase